MERIGNKEIISSYASPHLRPVAFNKLLLFTAFWAVIVTGFAIINRLRRWAKPISSHKLWPAIAQQVRDSAVNSNYRLANPALYSDSFRRSYVSLSSRFGVLFHNCHPAGVRSVFPAIKLPGPHGSSDAISLSVLINNDLWQIPA